MKKLILWFIFFLTGVVNAMSNNTPAVTDATSIEKYLYQLRSPAAVLYVAAHPDDENTRVITWLANAKGVRTGYFSFTRGDGGQNLIGSEIRDVLGYIRTHELMAARAIDGGEQFFSSANDFGFSKTPEETYRFWDKKKVLGELVYTIRKFRPSVIITRFSPTRGKTHGHHTASAQLAMEAFEISGDSSQYPEQVSRVGVWKAERIVWNTSAFFFQGSEKLDSASLLQEDVGGFDPLRGESYPETAARSRSQHRSQGFGSAGARGSSMEYFELLGGKPSTAGILDGIDLSWNTVQFGEPVGASLDVAWRTFSAREPWKSIPALKSALLALDNINDAGLKSIYSDRIKRAITMCSGLFVRATAKTAGIAPGEREQVSVEIVQRGPSATRLVEVRPTWGGEASTLNTALERNIIAAVDLPIVAARNQRPYTPFWLSTPGTPGMFVVPDKYTCIPIDSAAFSVEVTVVIEGQPVTVSVPVLNTITDPAKGELVRQVFTAPQLSATPEQRTVLATSNKPFDLKVRVRAWKNGAAGAVSLQMPKGWKASPEQHTVKIGLSGQDSIVSFSLTPPAEETADVISIVVDDVPAHAHQELRYEHIPTTDMFFPATVKVMRVNARSAVKTIAYVQGAGDEIPGILEQFGHTVTVLNEAALAATNDFSGYDAVVLGVRALNTMENLRFSMPKLLDYVQAGGTLVVQYNTNFRLVTDAFAPYPLTLSRDRVTEEDSPVSILQPTHPVFSSPNIITQKEFEGWTQERGLYFPSAWAPQFSAMLRMNDTGEKPLDGSLLIARHGKGQYIYTGLSFFRQLPEGVPGACKLFLNILSSGK